MRPTSLHPLHTAPVHYAALCLGFALVAGAPLQGGVKPMGGPPAPTVGHAEALAKIETALLLTTGPVDVVVRLKEPPLAEVLGRNARRTGHLLTRAQQIDRVQGMLGKQDAVVQIVRGNQGRAIKRLTRVLNAVIVRVNAEALPQLAALDWVASIRSSHDYTLDLGDTVPYLGAAALHSLGVDGDGVRVAVLDSGVDYTHRNLGGAGTPEAYAAAYGTSSADPLSTTRDGLFPTEKVVGGWDYVGENWPTEWDELESDEDPIDSKYNPVYSGHGTHVADIAAGASIDGTHKGVAPGAKIYAFKVCSSRALSCSGIAILCGLEASLRPDDPPDLGEAIYAYWDYWTVENPVDVVNLSLSEPYGLMQRDLVAAVQTLIDYGVVVVCSAGNSGDRPYILGSPSIAPGAISVAQTQQPTGREGWVTYSKQSGAYPQTILKTATVSWAPVTKQVSGQVIEIGPACTPTEVPDTVKGKIALIDRGGCSVSVAISARVMYAAQKGAVGVIVAMNVAGDPITFSQGAGTSGFVPTLVVSKADADAIKAYIRAGKTQATLVPVPMAGSMVGTSSRGPSQGGSSTFTTEDYINLDSLSARLKAPERPVDIWLAGLLSADTLVALNTYPNEDPNKMSLEFGLAIDMNKLLVGPCIYDEARFAGITLRFDIPALMSRNPHGEDLIRLNRMLFEDAYPLELARNYWNLQAIKPDLGAPGAMLSAKVGTGTGEEGFGGTSGAAPAVAGAAALLIEANPTAAPWEIKALLMNNAYNGVRTDPVLQPGLLAPISRIGAGELRVDKAYQAKLMAYDRDTLIPSLSFGYAALSQVGAPQVLTRTLRVKNLGANRTKFRVSQTSVQGGPGLTVGFQPAALTLDGGETGDLEVRVQVQPTGLPDWTLDGGVNGGDGDLLRRLEFSGYLFITGGGQSVRVPWHFLPHKSAEVIATPTQVAVGGTVQLTNPQGAVAGDVEVFALTGSSPRGLSIATDGALPAQGGIGDERYIIDLKSAGVRLTRDSKGTDVVQFAVATWDDFVHACYPVGINILLDTHGDATAEYRVFNSEYNGTGASGQSAVYVVRFEEEGDPIYGPYYYTIVDHNSSTMVLTVPLDQLGLTAESTLRFMVFAVDNRIQTGRIWDYLGGNGSPPWNIDPTYTYMVYNPALPKYLPNAWNIGVPIDGSATLGVTAGPGNNSSSPDHDGFLLFYENARSGCRSQEILIKSPIPVGPLALPSNSRVAD